MSLKIITEKAKLFSELTRMDHAVFVVLAILAAMLDSSGGLVNLDLVTASFIATPFLISLYAFAINDFLDFKSDSMNKRTDRPLVSGKIKLDCAKRIAEGLGILILVSMIINSFIAKDSPMLVTAVLILWAFFIASVLYSFYLKDLPLLGNLYIALSMAIPFIYGGVIAGKVTGLQELMFMAALLSGVAREIIKTIQDMEGDLAARKSRTLPIMIGRENSLGLAIVLLAGLAIYCWYPMVAGIWMESKEITLRAVLGIVALIAMASFWGARGFEPEKLEAAREVSKKLLLVAILAYVVAVLLSTV